METLRDSPGRPAEQVVGDDDALLGMLRDYGVVQRATSGPPPGSAVEVRPDDVLRFPPHVAVAAEVDFDEAGRAVVVVQCGSQQLTFDDAELLVFGRKLVACSDGFRAGDAVAWGLAGSEHAWSRVAELLDMLLTAGVLVRR